MKAAGDLFTVQDYAELPEGFPAQLIDGCLVKESPEYGHQRIVGRILASLWRVVERERALAGPVGVSIDEYNVFHPDVAVYAEPPPMVERRSVVPLAVFEVLSHSTRRRDRDVKCRRYLDGGVGEVWLVDAAEHVVEVHTKEGSRAARGAEAAVSDVVPGFALIPDEVLAGR